MEVNPYDSPREVGYFQPRQTSRWWDVVACVVTAVLIHGVLQAGVHTYIFLELNWGKYFAPWRGWLTALGQLLGVAWLAFMIFGLIFARWRKRRAAQLRLWV
jgi:hypothetical protein